MKKGKMTAVLLGVSFAVVMTAAACSSGDGKEEGTSAREEQDQSDVQEGQDGDAAQEQTVPDLEIEVPDAADGSQDGDAPDGSGETQEAERREEVVVLDPGHSSVVAEGTEPLGPGSSEQKAADTSGTSGTSTGIPEYELTLQVSRKLKAELEERGYTVVLTRNSNDVPVSCVQRAETANHAQADAFVRIHANGSEDASAQGAMTICITPDNPFYPELYSRSRELSDCIIDRLCMETGCENDGVWETDSMSGNNWSQVPATIVEMGYMTNPQEDEQMATEAYQEKLSRGIADGIDAYFGYSGA